MPIVSSSASSNYDGGFSPTATYDADTTTLWMTAGNSQNYGRDYMPWIQYTFDRVYSLGTMRVSNFNGGEYGRGAKDIEVLISQDGTTFTSLGYQQLALGSPTATGGTWQTFDLNGARAKYVKLAIHTNYYGEAFYGSPALEVPWANASITGLSEVQFYAAIPIVSSSASSSYDGRFPPTATYDADTTTLWMTAGNSQNEGRDYTPWIQYTFDRVYSLGTMRVSNFNGYEVARGAKDVEVLVSQDGTTFSSLGYILLSLGTSSTIDGVFETTHGTWQSFDLAGTPAKYVKLAIHTNYYGGAFYGSPALEVPWANASITGLSEVQFGDTECVANCTGNEVPQLISTDAPTVQTFDSLGAGAIAPLPSGWRIDKQATPRTVGTFAAASSLTGLSAGALMSSSALNGIYNFGAGVADSQAANYWANSPERAPGWLADGADLSSGGTKSGNLYIALRAPPDKDLQSLEVGYDLEQYRKGVNPLPFHVQLFSSPDGTTWTNAGSQFVSAFGSDVAYADTNPAPGNSTTVAPTKFAASIPRGTLYYLAWNYTIDSPTSSDEQNAQALAIDNVSIKGYGQCVADCSAKHCGDDLSDGCGGSCSPRCGSGDVGCVASSDCQSGLACTGFADGSTTPNVCVATGACVAVCTGKTCANSDDGCGHSCPGVCADRQAGCSTDTNCSVGSVCVQDGGSRVGLAAGDSVCMPAVCKSAIPASIPCGALNSECGLCPTIPQSVCDGLACGTDPTYGVACGSACAAGLNCISNQCVTPDLSGLSSLDLAFGLPAGQPPVQLRVPPLPFLQTTTVGALSGSFEVTDRGAADYSIPITVPPGRAGVEPKLSLEYTSTKGNGYLGVGWSLSGLSAISTCARIVSIDGENRSIQDDGADPYCLDGQRLIPVTGHPNEYRTEIDSFAKVVSYTSPDTDIPPNPDSSLPSGPTFSPHFPVAGFLVSTKDGKLLNYSPLVWHVSSGRAVVRTWGVSEMDDRNGNSIRIRYQQFYANPSACQSDPSDFNCDIVESAPASISYGHNSRLANKDNREVRFSYSDTRADKLIGFGENDLVIQRSRLLQHVRTFVDGQNARDYSISYEQSPSTQQSRIVSIQECAAHGGSLTESCKAPTAFGYQNPPQTLAKTQFSATSTGAIREYVAFDWDGDGATDLVSKYDLAVRLSDRHGGFSDINPWANLSPLYGIPEITSGSVFDFDQDGDDDLISFTQVLNPSTGTLFGNSTVSFVVYLSNAIHVGDAPLSQVVTLELPAQPSDANPFVALSQLAQNTRLVDVDGDGLKDLLSYFQNDAGHGPIELLAYYPGLAGGGFGTSIILPLPVGDLWPSPTNDVDIDGDGATELMFGNSVLHVGANSTTWSNLNSNCRNTNDFPAILADINGDGLKDIVEEGGFDSTYACLNEGGHFGAPEKVADGGVWTALTSVLDLNGDHCDDLITQFEVIYGSPTGQMTVVGQPFLTVAPVGDFFGDGTQGFIGTRLGDSEGNHWIVTPHAGQQDLLSVITDGNGKQVRISYDGAAYNPLEGTHGATSYADTVSLQQPGDEAALIACAWPALCDRSAGQVVSQSSVKSGARSGVGFADFQTLNSSTYAYVRSTHGVQGRPGLGFHSRSISTYDGAGGFVKKENLTYDNWRANENNFGGIYYPFAGRLLSRDEVTAPDQSELEDHPAALHTATTYTWTEQLSSGGRSMVFLGQRDTADADNNALLPGGPEQITLGSTNFRLLRTQERFQEDPYGNTTHAERREQWTKESLSDVYNSYHTVDTRYDLSAARVNSWLTSKPLHRTETDSYSDDLVTKEAEFSFDDAGNLTQLGEDQDDCGIGVVTKITPNGYGDIREVQRGRPDQCPDTNPVRGVHFDFDSLQIYPVTVVNALGQKTSVRFDASTGALLSAVDPNGLASQYGYDAFGRLLSTSTPGETTTRSYRPANTQHDALFDVRSVVSVVEDSSTGSHSDRDLDALGRLVRTSQFGLNAKLVQSETEYNAAGLIGRVTRPHLSGDVSQGFHQYLYDARQRLTTDTDAAGASTRYGYASASNCRSDICPTPPDTTGAASLPPASELVLREFNVRGVFSPRDNHLTLTYLDHRDQPLRVVDGAGKQSLYRYGAFSTLHQAIDPDSNLTILRYDSRQRPYELDDADKGKETYTYTAFDELETAIASDETSHTRTLHRDALGRVFRLSDSTDGDTRFCYDAACDQSAPPTDSLATTNEVGRLVEAISPSQIATRYEFEPAPIAAGMLTGNNRGFLKAIHRTIPHALTGTTTDEQFTTQLRYNAKSLLSEADYPASAGSDFKVSYSYDSAGNLHSIADPNANPADPHGVYWTLSDDYQGLAPASEQLGDGTVSTSQYEALTGRIQHLSTAVTSPTQAPTPLLDLGYTYYSDGLLKTTDRQLAVTGEQRSELYGYDAVDRITERSESISTATSGVSQSETSAYSDSGNISFRSGIGAYTYDPQRRHRVSNAGGVDFTYYDNGDVKTRSGGVVGSQQTFEYTGFHLPKRVLIGGASNPPEVSFEYDAEETRTLKTSSLGQRVYAAEGYERFTPTATGPHAFAGETREHVYKVFGPTGVIAQVVRGEGASQQLVGQSTLYLHTDRQGSPALIRDTAGVNHGAPHWSTSGDSDGDSTWASTTDPLARTVRIAYTGHEFDEELGLTNMGGRIFDQSVGRFLEPDPLVSELFNTQGLNRYSYTFNSPLNFIDPSGFDPWHLPGCPGSKGSGGGGKAPTKPSAGAGEHSHGQGAKGSDSANRGRPTGESRGAPDSAGTSPTGQGQGAGGPTQDPTGGDTSAQKGRGQAPADQASHGAGHNGDFASGKPQADAGTTSQPGGGSRGDTGEKAQNGDPGAFLDNLNGLGDAAFVGELGALGAAARVARAGVAIGENGKVYGPAFRGFNGVTGSRAAGLARAASNELRLAGGLRSFGYFATGIAILGNLGQLNQDLQNGWGAANGWSVAGDVFNLAINVGALTPVGAGGALAYDALSKGFTAPPSQAGVVSGGDGSPSIDASTSASGGTAGY